MTDDAGLLERGRWVIRHVATAGEDIDLAEVAANIAPNPNVSDHVEAFAIWAERIGLPFTIDDEMIDSAGMLHFFVTNAAGRRWDFFIEFEPDGGRRVVHLRLQRRLPDGVEIRDARPEDSGALAKLYAATPIQAGDLRVTIDAGDDYFVMTRLMGDVRTLVALEDGQPIGLYTGTLYPGSMRGHDVVIAAGCHNRIAEGKAGGGVWANMNRRMLDGFEGRFDVALAFVLTGNTAAARLTTDGAWPAVPVRAVIPCPVDAPAAGRPATRDDAAEIAEILNATHGRHDLYRRRTGEDIVTRLERDPSLYGWDDLWIHDGAVVGIGQHLQGRTTETTAGTESSGRALVFDCGAASGAEDALAALLAWRGADGRRCGATHLSVFTCEASPLYPLFVRLASTTETYDLFIPGEPPDEDAAARGVYVDQIHF